MNIRHMEHRNNIWCIRCNAILDDGVGKNVYINPRQGGLYNVNDLYDIIKGECNRCGSKTIRRYIKKDKLGKYGYKKMNAQRDNNPALGWKNNKKKHSSALGCW